MLEPDFQAHQAEWIHLEESGGPFASLARELPAWIRDFPFYFSHDELCLSHCPGYPFSRDGMPGLFCQGDGFLVDDQWFGTAKEAAARLEELLSDQHKLIFAGNVDHKAYAWLRSRMSTDLEGSCPMDRSPWFERANRQCWIRWADSEIGLDFVEDEKVVDSSSYPWEEAVSAAESWLLGRK